MNKDILLELIKQDINDLQKIISQFHPSKDIHPLEIEICTNKIKNLAEEFQLLVLSTNPANKPAVSEPIPLETKRTSDSDTAVVSSPMPEVMPEPAKPAEPAPMPEVKPEPAKLAEPAPMPEVTQEPAKPAEPAPMPEVKPEPAKLAEPAPMPEVKPEPVKPAEPAQMPEVTPEPAKPAEPAPMPEVKPEPLKPAEPAPMPEVKPAETTQIQEKVKSQEKSKHAKVLGEELGSDKKSLFEILQENQGETDLASQFKTSKLDDINKGIPLNDRIWFIRELFDGNSEDYRHSIEQLNKQQDLEGAIAFIQSKYNWDAEVKSVQKFLRIVSRRFI